MGPHAKIKVGLRLDIHGRRLESAFAGSQHKRFASRWRKNSAASRPACCVSRRHRQPAIFFLASAIPRFLAHYPEISLDLSFTDALTDIVAERFDAGIRIGERIERD